MQLNQRVFTASEYLRGSGVSAHQFRRLVAQGAITQIGRRHYAHPTHDTPEERHLTALAARMDELDPGMTISHVSAALLWGLPVARSLLAEVHATHTGPTHGRRRPGLHLHSTPITPAEIVLQEGRRITSASRTVVDTIRMSPPGWALALGDAALRARIVTPEQLDASLRRAKGRAGVEQARQIIPLADPLPQSPLESLSRWAMLLTGLPAPVLQYPILLRGRRVAIADFAWPEYGVIGECDGAIKYGERYEPGLTPQQAVMREKQREELIRQAGWWIVRWGFDVAVQPDRLATRLSDAFAFGRPIVVPAS